MNVATVCRICLEGATGRRGVYQRCPCAFYHDDCFKEWLSRRRAESCEVCGSRYVGVRNRETEITVANLQRQAIMWLLVYGIIIAMIWVLKGLIETYSDCVFEAREARDPDRECAGWNDIEELLIVIVAVGTAALCFHTMSVTVCPREAGLIVTSRKSDLIVIPGQGLNRSSSRSQSVVRI